MKVSKEVGLRDVRIDRCSCIALLQRYTHSPQRAEKEELEARDYRWLRTLKQPQGSVFARVNR